MLTPCDIHGESRFLIIFFFKVIELIKISVAKLSKKY